jgi:hypothetical protein
VTEKIIDAWFLPLYVIQVLHVAFWAIPVGRWFVARQFRSRSAHQHNPGVIGQAVVQAAPHPTGLLAPA